MNKIIFPLEPKNQSQLVADLQDGLQLVANRRQALHHHLGADALHYESTL